MELIKWNPARDVFGLHHRMDHLLDEFFSPATWSGSNLSLWNLDPAVDVYENNDNIVIQAELPGLEKKDIVVDVKDRVLTLKGERSSDHEVKQENYYQRERTFGKFERSFTLPIDIDPEKIDATYKNGVLKITIPKPEEQKPKQVTVH